MVTSLERSRTGWDVVLGILLVLGGIYVLGNAVLATAISVLVIAWLALIGGVMLLVRAIMSIRSEGVSWSVLAGGAMLTVLGLFMLRSPLVGAVALTLMAGALFFASGIMRLGVAFTVENHRWVFVLSGLISLVLALWIFINPGTATLTLLGILLGVQMITEGVTMVSVGRLRMIRTEKPTPV